MVDKYISRLNVEQNKRFSKPPATNSLNTEQGGAFMADTLASSEKAFTTCTLATGLTAEQKNGQLLFSQAVTGGRLSEQYHLERLTMTSMLPLSLLLTFFGETSSVSGSPDTKHMPKGLDKPYAHTARVVGEGKRHTVSSMVSFAGAKIVRVARMVGSEEGRSRCTKP